MHKKKKRTFLIIGTSLLVLTASAFAFHHRYLKVYYGYEPLTFSKEAWAAASPEVRGYMSNDLLENNDLKRKGRKEIEALLGTPDHENRGSIYYDIGYVGFNPNALMVFPLTLVVHFDENGLSDEAYTFD